MITPTICRHGVTVDESTYCRACQWERENPDKVTSVPSPLRPLHVFQAGMRPPEICHNGGARIAIMNDAREDHAEYSRLLTASANFYMKHCHNPVESAEEDLLEEALEALRSLTRAYGASDLRNGNSGECWDKCRAVLSKTTRNCTE